MGGVGCARGKAHRACPQTRSLQDTSEPRTQETRRAEGAQVLLTLTGRSWPWRPRAGLRPLFLSRGQELIFLALQVMWSLSQ